MTTTNDTEETVIEATAEEFQPAASPSDGARASAKTDSAGAAAASAKPDLEDARLQALHAVPVDLQVVLGHAALPVAQLLKLSRGAVVEIDRKVGECVDIHVNSHLVARGEVVILDDNKLGITLTDIASTQSLANLPGRTA